MRKKHRRPQPYTIIWARLPEQYTDPFFHYDEYGQVQCISFYPNDEVFDWLDANVPEYSFQDRCDGTIIELKNEQQFILARLKFSVTYEPQKIKWRPRKRSHWRNEHHNTISAYSDH